MEELNHIGAWMEPGLTSEDEEKAAEESMMMMIAFNELQYYYYYYWRFFYGETIFNLILNNILQDHWYSWRMAETRV